MPATKRSSEDGKPRSAKARPRHNEIIAAAAQLFYEKGFDATTTQDIGEAVGMLKGSLYYYIDSKEDVLLQIVEELHGIFASNIETVNKVEGSILDKVWVFVYRLVVANSVNYVGSAVFFNEFRSLTKPGRARIIKVRDRHEQLLRSLLADGQRSGEVCAQLDAKMTATAILTMCNSIYRWYRPGGEWSPEAIARSYADLVNAQVLCNPTVHKFHGRIDGAALVEKLDALSLVPVLGAD
ncbi:MAG TPA: TetR/AcrR family transcriptional regulator [Acidimicrobiales bacterium]|nr:TetR/AcrR family transcriptional regulator [Acidimicrobiales bacterium]